MTRGTMDDLRRYAPLALTTLLLLGALFALSGGALVHAQLATPTPKHTATFTPEPPPTATFTATPEPPPTATFTPTAPAATSAPDPGGGAGDETDTSPSSTPTPLPALLPESGTASSVTLGLGVLGLFVVCWYLLNKPRACS